MYKDTCVLAGWHVTWLVTNRTMRLLCRQSLCCVAVYDGIVCPSDMARKQAKVGEQLQ
jgi:hypothetical protein